MTLLISISFCILGCKGDDNDKGELDRLFSYLEHESENARIMAIKKLGDIGGDRVVKKLLEQLPNQTVSVKIAILRTLGRMHDTRAIPALINSLGDPKYSIWREAAGALVLFDKAAVNSLIDNLSNPNPLIAGRCALCLGKIGDARALPYLKAQVPGENDYVEANAAMALANFGAEELAYLASRLPQASPSAQRNIANALALAEGPGISVLKEQLSSTDPNLLSAVLEGLGKAKDPSAIPDIISKLGHHSPAVRGAATTALGEIGDARGLKAVLIASHDDDVLVCLKANLAVRKMVEDAQLADALVAAYSPYPEQRLQALAILDGYEGEFILDCLERLAEDEEPAIRELAKEILEKRAMNDRKEN